MADKENSNIKQEYNNATTGLNLDQTLNQIEKGRLTYALNAAVENFDANSVNYQNEQGNVPCFDFPAGFILIGRHFIPEKVKQIFFLTNPETGESEIGYVDNNDCIYHTLVNDPCLGWDINHPIHKIVHKITNCSTEIYWADNIARRHLDIENVPYKLKNGTELCDPEYSDELDCNQLKVQPDFDIPNLSISDVTNGGELKAGAYQFTIQYSDSFGNGYTSYYSVTNPTPIVDLQITTVNFDYNVGKSIVVNIDGLDTTGQFQYFNLAVIKTINNISSVDLIGTYFIDDSTKQITYTGQSLQALSINDIFERFPYYELADDITAVQDVLVWKGVTSIDRVNYQKIANQISLKWQSYRIPATENYADEVNATNLRGYLRDEIYAFEIAFELRNGKLTDGFHIPGRMMGTLDIGPDVAPTEDDYVGDGTNPSPHWKVYNTASVSGFADEYDSDPSYKGPYQYGEFAYWESTEEYPCNDELWGDLAGQKIRHHKFPDVLVSPIIEGKTFTSIDNMEMGDVALFPIGVKIDVTEITALIAISDLTQEQKDDIVGIRIFRGDRSTNKSIVAKGILRNVNKYDRAGQEYYYPNYPYNDLNVDPFLLATNNAWLEESKAWLVTCDVVDATLGHAVVQFTDPYTGKLDQRTVELNETIEFCSLTRPITLYGTCTIGPGDYDVWYVSNFGAIGARATWSDPFTNDNSTSTLNDPWINGHCLATAGDAFARVNVDDEPALDSNNGFCFATPTSSDLRKEYVPEQTMAEGVVVPNVSRRSSLQCDVEVPLPAISTDEESSYRQVFNSPETSFGQPFLGDVLKIENIMYGEGKAHFVEVKNNAKYKLLTAEAQRDALDSSDDIADITSTYNATAMFAAYQAYLTIYINGITRKNYAYSFNSIADYNYVEEVGNNGNKQRTIGFTKYLIPTVQSVGDDISINNYQRETSVFIRTDEEKNPLPFPSTSVGVTDDSRFTISESGNCAKPAKENDINVVSYYASMKNTFVNQWGQIYSYSTVDTGFNSALATGANETYTFFGGDTFIGRFAFKTKVPFFIDNRVGAPDDSDIFYDEIGNIAYPKYWHSARSVLEDYQLPSQGTTISNIISYKAHNFDCPNDPASVLPPNAGAARTFYDGYFYLFAYGVPYFYCESSYNTELRQAFNDREGDFWPHVTTGIPDDWVQENYVSIANDNTYNYNVTYSKQNKETTISHLPPDWEECDYTNYPFRAIYSDPQVTDADNRVNNWLIYRALSYHDFPQNYGSLTSIDGIQNKAVLARFVNKSLLYNSLVTIDTSNPLAAYVGNPKMFSNPPIDFAETDLGYVGSQHKFLLKIPQGQITIDAKRGQVFLLAIDAGYRASVQAIDISGFGSGLQRFMTDHLPFKILKYFPNINIDNHFKGIGLHGVYDAKFDRVIITKLDYIPLSDDIKYDAEDKEFYHEKTINNLLLRTRVDVWDQNYFCNKSWTVSYNINTKSWISFHSYLPNFYIPENEFFYSGLNICCDDGFEAIIGTLVPYTTTTTTTIETTDIPLPTTTTTTTYYDCLMFGGIFEQTGCELEGDAIITVPATTTTTICSRPLGLNDYIFYTGWVDDGPALPVDTTGNSAAACNGIYIYVNGLTSQMLYFTGSASSINIGVTVYFGAGGNDCTIAPDGWYFTDETAYDNYVFRIENGDIVEIIDCSSTTTTTTTVAPTTTTTTTTNPPTTTTTTTV